MSVVDVLLLATIIAVPVEGGSWVPDEPGCRQDCPKT
jgi:hypothetical protein